MQAGHALTLLILGRTKSVRLTAALLVKELLNLVVAQVTGLSELLDARVEAPLEAASQHGSCARNVPL